MAVEISSSRKSGSATGRLWRSLLAARGRRRGRVGRHGLRRQQQRAGRQEGRGRLRRRRADRDPDRGLQRQRAVREERRRVARALQHDEADDRRGGLPRHQAGRRQTDRRISRQRKRLAQGRRARRRLDHVRGDPQQDFRSTICCTAPSSRAATMPAWCWRRASPATSAAFAGDDDQARARTRPDASRPSPIPTGCPIPATR